MSRRSYNQFCATAKTLDVVGERWTLLIIRELITGPKRYKDLLASLPGIGNSLLAARLKHLESAALVRRAELPPPAGSTVYELTESGRDLEPAIMAIARWGLKWALGSPTCSGPAGPCWRCRPHTTSGRRPTSMRRMSSGLAPRCSTPGCRTGGARAPWPRA